MRRNVITNEFEDIFIEENEISISELVHEAIQRKIDLKNGIDQEVKRDRYRAVRDDFVIIFLGILFFGLSYVVINLIAFIALNIGALFCLCGGVGLLVKELLGNKKLKSQERGGKGIV